MPKPDPSVEAQQGQAAQRNALQIQQNVGTDTANLLKMFGQTSASQTAGLTVSPLVGGPTALGGKTP